MTICDVAAILIAVAAVSGYVDHRVLRLPPTSGTLLVALISSLVVVVIEQIVPEVQLRPAVERFVRQIDFDQTLIHGPGLHVRGCCVFRSMQGLSVRRVLVYYGVGNHATG